MNRDQLKEIRTWVRKELAASADFWLKYGMDGKNGGVYTCLDREGRLFSTDKSVWMQGRCAWTYAFLCHVYGKRDEWMAASKSCLDFMEKACINRAAGNRMYFTVTGDGRSLRQRRYCFSEGFYSMANAEYYGLTGEKVYLERARESYDLIWNLVNGLIEDPTGLGPKTIPETRTGRALADMMIYLNITSILRRCDPGRKALYDERADICVDTIFRYHHKPELKCTLETVGPNGEFMSDVSAGRFVNPGHDIECSWFLLAQADYKKDDDLRKKAIEVFDMAIANGWDETYGGILYFIDCMGFPPEAYEHDMKLWWTHNETMIASLMIYRDTGDERYLDWFLKVIDYCRTYFSDPEYGEWYGYLRRDGKPTEPACKGCTFKGPFHVPRALAYVDQLLGDVLGEK